MGPIPNNPDEAIRFHQLLQEAAARQAAQSRILDNVGRHTLSRTTPGNLATSGARLQESGVTVRNAVKSNQALRAEIEILRAARNLNMSPSLFMPSPGSTPTIPSVTPGITGRAVGAINPLLMFLQAALFPSNLNTGEDAELAKIRSAGEQPAPTSQDFWQLYGSMPR